MTALAWIQFVLPILQSVLSGLTNDPKVTEVAAEAISGIRNAISELSKVHGSEITRPQLEGLRVNPQW